MAAPLRVGILNDMSEGPPAPDDTEHWLRLVTDEFINSGRIDRAVEFVHAWGLGLPSGTAAAVERAYAALAGQGVLMIVGPAIGDNALVATPVAEHYRVPTLNWAGAERARGEYMFHLQVGSHEDESIVLARHLMALGSQRVAVAHDKSPIGRRHVQFLQNEADVLGLRLAATASLAPLAENAQSEVDRLLAASPDALVYLGLGLSAPAVARAASARGYPGPCLMNTAGIRGHYAEFARIIDGWIYVDMHSDRNTTLRALRQRLGLPLAKSLAAAKGYDLGRLVAEGLARATERTRDGVKDGLDSVKWLDAAEGHEGTLLGFGKYDRGALHGRYLVMRQWRDGNSIEVDK
jgi:ABC-type branched-subunit amino acid transport system substrate-binding protein